MKKYIVVEVPKYLSEDDFHLFTSFEKVFSSDFARDIGAFMWGRSSGKYAIYKNEKLAPLAHICSDVKELENYLENIKD